MLKILFNIAVEPVREIFEQALNPPKKKQRRETISTQTDYPNDKLMNPTENNHLSTKNYEDDLSQQFRQVGVNEEKSQSTQERPNLLDQFVNSIPVTEK